MKSEIEIQVFEGKAVVIPTREAELIQGAWSLGLKVFCKDPTVAVPKIEWKSQSAEGRNQQTLRTIRTHLKATPFQSAKE